MFSVESISFLFYQGRFSSYCTGFSFCKDGVSVDQARVSPDRNKIIFNKTMYAADEDELTFDEGGLASDES